MTTNHGSHNSGGTRWRKIVGIVAIVIVLLLLFVRFGLSPILTAQVNKKLSAMQGYSGHVGGIQLALWRGDVSLTDFQVVARGRESEGPVVRVGHAALKISWPALFKGRIGGRGLVEHAELNVMRDQASEAAEQAKEKLKEKEREHGHPNDHAAEVRQWQDELREAFPMEITRFEMKDCRIHFVDRTVDPNPEMTLEHFHLIATNLVNRAKPGGDQMANVTVDADVTEKGHLNVQLQADPVAPQPRFHVTMEMKDVSLTQLNNFALAYAKANITSGTFSDYIEVNAEGGHYDGYTKPFFENLKFEDAPNKDESAIKRVATKAASAVTKLLKNDQGKVATKAPFSGNFNDNKVGIWTTIQNLLRNAFVQSLREGLEGQGK